MGRRPKQRSTITLNEMKDIIKRKMTDEYITFYERYNVKVDSKDINQLFSNYGSREYNEDALLRNRVLYFCKQYCYKNGLDFPERKPGKGYSFDRDLALELMTQYLTRDIFPFNEKILEMRLLLRKLYGKKVGIERLKYIFYKEFLYENPEDTLEDNSGQNSHNDTHKYISRYVYEKFRLFVLDRENILGYSARHKEAYEKAKWAKSPMDEYFKSRFSNINIIEQAQKVVYDSMCYIDSFYKDQKEKHSVDVKVKYLEEYYAEFLLRYMKEFYNNKTMEPIMYENAKAHSINTVAEILLKLSEISRLLIPIYYGMSVQLFESGKNLDEIFEMFKDTNTNEPRRICLDYLDQIKKALTPQ